MWLDDTRYFSCTDIHFLDPTLVNSGSKVTREQFYALRVLRRPIKAAELAAKHRADLGIPDLQEARDLLEAHPPWRLFLDAVGDLEQKASASLGMFALVLKNQRMACGRVHPTAPVSNMTLRTRPLAQVASERDEDDDDAPDGDDHGDIDASLGADAEEEDNASEGGDDSDGDGENNDNGRGR